MQRVDPQRRRDLEEEEHREHQHEEQHGVLAIGGEVAVLEAAGTLHLVDELGVFDSTGSNLAVVKLIKNSHQNQADYQPDCEVFEHVVQACSPYTAPSDKNNILNKTLTVMYVQANKARHYDRGKHLVSAPRHF